jgi:HEAT repeat protein
MSAPSRVRCPLSELASAAAEAASLAEQGSEREVAELRTKWQDELEAAARSPDYRERAVAYRAIGQFRFRQKVELLRRGLDDESPACRGSALISLELLSREHPGLVNNVRPLLHELASHDDNQAVRRLAIFCLNNGSPQRETILILSTIADDDEQNRELRAAAGKVSEQLRKKAAVRR